MKKDDTAERNPMKIIFNYNDVFFSFIYDDRSGCVHRSREYALNYVYSGRASVFLFLATTISRCISEPATGNGIAVFF